VRRFTPSDRGPNLRHRAWSAAASGLLICACSGNPRPDAASLADCSPVPNGDTAVFAALEGAHRLVLEAVRGPRAGQVAEAEVRLVPFPIEEIDAPAWADGPDVRIAFYGGTDLRPAEVGAVADGSRSSMDPKEAGVLVVQQRVAAGWSITIRLGSGSNRFERPAIEGPYMALTVTEVCEGAFSGTWASGRLSEEASGTFVAERRLGA